jgi:acyl-coenzyme A thioesterase PaaI-like protein
VANNVLAMRLWRRLGGSTPGRWLFSRVVCLKAPYFGSVSPRIQALEPGLCVAELTQRRKVQNHIGTVHAIALCNLAELCAGLVTDVSIPADMRWIPKGMTVRYLAKARGRIRATARPVTAPASSATGYDLVIRVSLKDAQEVEVAAADIDMWVTPRSARSSAAP